MNQNNIAIKILIREKYQDLSEIFEKYLKNHLTQVNFVDLCEKIIVTLELTSKNYAELEHSLREFFKNYWKTRNYEEFSNIISGWILLNQLQHIPTKNFKDQYQKILQKKKDFYQNLLANIPDSDKIEIKNILTAISSKITAFSKLYHFETPIIAFRDKLLNIELTNLQEIFSFFAKQNLVIGKFTTFEGLTIQQEHWSCALFIKFCTIFKIYNTDTYKKQKISRNSLMSIYKNHSISNKYMDFSMFLESLNILATDFVSVPNEFTHTFEIGCLSVEDKKILMLEYMKIASTGLVRQKLKHSNNSFARPDYQARIPLNDSCRNYKFSVDYNTKLKLKQLKIEKEKGFIMKKKNCFSKNGSEADLRIKIKKHSVRNFHLNRPSYDQVIVYKLASTHMNLKNEGDLEIEFC